MYCRLMSWLLLLFLGCLNDQTKTSKTAEVFTRAYGNQKLQAVMAGSDCQVLLIKSSVPLDRATIESIHYGIGEYGAHYGGAEQFAAEYRLRAVVYRDSAGHMQTYGATTRAEAESMPVCD